MATRAARVGSAGLLESRTAILSMGLYPEARSPLADLVHESKTVMVETVLWAMSLSSAQATVASTRLQFKMLARLKNVSLKLSEVRR